MTRARALSLTLVGYIGWSIGCASLPGCRWTAAILRDHWQSIWILGPAASLVSREGFVVRYVVGSALFLALTTCVIVTERAWWSVRLLAVLGAILVWCSWGLYELAAAM